ALLVCYSAQHHESNTAPSQVHLRQPRERCLEPRIGGMMGTKVASVPLIAGLVLLAVAACGPGDGTGDSGTTDVAERCAGHDPRIELPPGFCAQVVSEGIMGARHIDVAPNGDV